MTVKLIESVLLAALGIILLSASSSATILSPNIGIAAGDDLTELSKDQHKLDLYFQNLTHLGVTWVRWDIEWRVVQENDSKSYNWTVPDKVAKTAKKYNIKQLAIIDLPPEWAVEKGSYDEQNISPPENFEAFAYFANQVALRYKAPTYGPIEYFEIWNEPNRGGTWYPSSNAESYAELLKLSYTAIKEANPNAKVISGGLSMEETKDNNIAPIDFINSLYGAGAKGYFDSIALHPYTYPAAPNSQINWNGWKSIDSVREIMVKNGDNDKKIWITEYGAPTNGLGTEYKIWEIDYTDYGINFNYNYDYMDEEAQAEMFRQAIEFYNKTDFLDAFFAYTLLDDSALSGTEGYFGLIREDGAEKPAYGVIKNISNPLGYPPVLAAIGNKTVNVNSLMSFTISATDPNGDKVTYSATGLPTGAKLNATTGKFTWIPTATGKYNVKFIATANGQTDEETIWITVTTATGSSVSYTPTYDNRLRESSPTSVLSTTTYLDVGKSTSICRDVMLFDLSSYDTTDTISKATLSLYWYYPASTTRTSDTVVEVYRPVAWDPNYVSWNNRASGTAWSTAGGSWYDKNGVAQGSTPYATLTFPASTVPGNKYYDFDVTQLVQEYGSGKYKNTGFFLKAKTESGNYIAFYSVDASNTAFRPKLTVSSTSGSTVVDNLPVANAGVDKTAMTGSTVIFNASASTDDKSIASYSWDFDLSNGITAESTTITASHIYTVAGTYTATLTVTDTAGQVATDTVKVIVSSATSTTTASYSPTYDNRLRSGSPTSVLSTTTYLDIGRSSATVRDLLLFDLSSYKTTDTISKATLSLYWYYPAGTTRTSDTVVEVYRPVEWDPKYVNWNSRASGTLWTNAGGNWYDKNAVSQGTTPYASITFAASTLPDNKYHEFDVTQLVQEYVSGKYKNTGFFLKARTESGNYIAFYSADASNAAVRPKLTITSISGSTAVDNPPIANAGADKTTTVGTSVAFDASASTDDKSIALYSWDFDLSNGITAEATTITASKTYTATGTYTVTLTVIDTTGQKSTDTVQVVVSSASSPVSTVSYTPTYDNRLRSNSPTSVLSTTTYLDIGRSSAIVRDVMLFDLSSYKTTDTISKATLSLYWYYPAGTTRTSDTVVEVYRPVEWDSKYVTWNSRASGVSWTTAGGNWYDKNGIAQGTAPYASVTFAGTKLPDNKYYEFDVTQLVQEYVNGKYKNTGLFLKARTESGNYIAFYSADASNAAVRPKLNITR